MVNSVDQCNSKLTSFKIRGLRRTTGMVACLSGKFRGCFWGRCLAAVKRTTLWDFYGLGRGGWEEGMLMGCCAYVRRPQNAYPKNTQALCNAKEIFYQTSWGNGDGEIQNDSIIATRVFHFPGMMHPLLHHNNNRIISDAPSAGWGVVGQGRGGLQNIQSPGQALHYRSNSPHPRSIGKKIGVGMFCNRRPLPTTAPKQTSKEIMQNKRATLSGGSHN